MKIGVIGLGLIGGSIFKELMSKNYDVVGISNSQKGEKIFKNYDKLKDCNLIFVCSAMNKTLKILDNLNNYVNKDTIVADVCSLKEFVTGKAYNYKFIPSHPMAGTEKKGFENSFIGLFKGAKWAIISDEKSNILIDIIKELGAIPIFTNAKDHDEAVALISHMPLVLSQALFYTAKDNKLALELASSGFRDMTRLAMSNTEMACDMVKMNSKNIEQAILKLYKSIGELTCGNYPKIIETIQEQRSKMSFN